MVVHSRAIPPSARTRPGRGRGASGRRARRRHRRGVYGQFAYQVVVKQRGQLGNRRSPGRGLATRERVVRRRCDGREDCGRRHATIVQCGAMAGERLIQDAARPPPCKARASSLAGRHPARDGAVSRRPLGNISSRLVARAPANSRFMQPSLYFQPRACRRRLIKNEMWPLGPDEIRSSSNRTAGEPNIRRGRCGHPPRGLTRRRPRRSPMRLCIRVRLVCPMSW